MVTRTTLTGLAVMEHSLVASQLRRLIFVGGSPRSGTTLVQRILNCHPEIYGGPEFDFVPIIVDLFRDMHSSIRTGRIDAILDENHLEHVFRCLLVSLLLPKLEAEGVSYLSEKTPRNVLAFAWLEEHAPEAKKILVVRDPRDVVSSMLEVGRRQKRRAGRTSWFTRDPVAAVNYMNRCLKAGTSLAESSANCLVLYYEDIVSDPLALANQIYHFVGVHELDRLDLEGEKFEAARNHESWIDWSTCGTISGGVEKGRVGLAKKMLKRSEWDYVCLKTIRHPLLTNRYSLSSPKWTARARWCIARTLTTRIKHRALDSYRSLRRLTIQAPHSG
jgi:hypothetical protein